MTNLVTTFNPDWVSPPGETIVDLIKERQWPQTELASRLGYSPKHISQLINGKAPITEETALRLERVLGGSTKFWLTREAHYRARLAKFEAITRNRSWTGWLDKLPIRELMKVGVIPKRRIDTKTKPDLVEELLRFFGVASPEEWYSHYEGMEASFHRTRTEQSDSGSILAWLRLGEIQAEQMETPRFNRAFFLEALREIRTFTVLREEDYGPRLFGLCLNSGVSLVLVPYIPRAHVSGVARWLSPHKPIIQLSLYGKSNDRFWFTFFHEAAHLLLHEGKGVFLDDLDDNNPDLDEEHTANAWARDFLIPPKYSNELSSLQTKAAVQSFAKKIGLHPGIVVGRIQHDGIIPSSWMNQLKVSLQNMGKAGQNPAVCW